METYKFFQNAKCEYFPCHKTAEPEDFNCLFCYCPLYALGKDCGGNYSYTNTGIKDCSCCLVPHQKDGYDKIMAKIPLLIELAKEK